ncbi:glycosyltransferase family 4 protein [Micromonospora sp. NPDC049645]|uniref:glycosyltransferase n=1 Tax=Micromonospora sp. NPDC049645 TaxID=3155508 RepID=UPI003438A2E5
MSPAADLVLVVDHQLPTPDRDSGSLRLQRVIDELLALGRQVLFFPQNARAERPYADRLRAAGVGVIIDRRQQTRFLADEGHRIGLALLCRPEPAVQMLARVRDAAPGCLVAYDTVDVHFRRLDRQAALAAAQGGPDRYALRARADSMRAVELLLTRECDVTLVVSDEERRLLEELVPDAWVEVLSNIHRPPRVRVERASTPTVLFVGNYLHEPNVDAARWLCTEIMPLVWAEIPDATVDLVGDAAPPPVRELAGDRVTVHGWVPELAPVYQRARVAVAPLRYGAGVKGKVGEAIEYGVPVVGTPIAFEGMGLVAGTDVLGGETAAELAGQLVRLLRDDELAARLVTAAGAGLSARFDARVARTVLDRLLSRPPAGAAPHQTSRQVVDSKSLIATCRTASVSVG